MLELYDTRFRNLAAPLTVASPDVYIDVQNAASILFRLQRLGVDVGNRWEELADKAEARIGDCLSAFTLPHWLMALTATGRTAAAERMVEAVRAFANGRGTVPPIVRDYVLPIAEAQLAHAAGRHAEAVALMRPAIGGMYRLGGSHTQQDVLEQLFVDAALKAGSTADIRLALERVAGRRAIPPERFVGWREAAKRAAVEALSAFRSGAGHFAGQIDAARNWVSFSPGRTKSTRTLSPALSLARSYTDSPTWTKPVRPSAARSCTVRSPASTDSTA